MLRICAHTNGTQEGTKRMDVLANTDESWSAIGVHFSAILASTELGGVTNSQSYGM
jgi:hypothetical protein